MKEGGGFRATVIFFGALAGMIVGCLITWIPIRLSFCAVYNTPDCEEIVLMAFPLYCFITPFVGGLITDLIYRRKRNGNGRGTDNG